MKNIKFSICNDHKDLITFMESTVCSVTILQVRVGICGYLKVLASYLLNVFAQVHQKKVFFDTVTKKMFISYKSVIVPHAPLFSSVTALLEEMMTITMLNIAQLLLQCEEACGLFYVRCSVHDPLLFATLQLAREF